MRELESSGSLPEAGSTARRDLRAIVADGIFFSAMVGVGETYVPAFALAAGLGEVVAGLIATLPVLAGALFQLLTPLGVRHLRSYRRWIVLCAAIQALSFLPLIYGAARGSIDIVWLFVPVIAYWSAGMAVSPAWNAWITTLVPEPIRTGFFARRTRWAQCALFIAILIGGVALDQGRRFGVEFETYALLFAAAMVTRLISARFLASQSEAPHIAEAHRALNPLQIAVAVERAGSARVLVYLLSMQAVVYIAAPFFTPYMLEVLSLTYAEFMVLTATAFVARFLVLPSIGRAARRRGTRFILWWGAIGIIPLPGLWLLSDYFYYLLALQVLSGVAWAALEFATLLSFFEGIEDHERASVLSAFNLLNAFAMVLGAFVGSQLFVLLENPEHTYVWVFALSTAGRLLMLPILRGTRAARHVIDLQQRTLAVRPSAGIIARPILASLESEEEQPLPSSNSK